MAYRTDVSSRDRSGAIAAVVAIHAALLFAFLHLSGKIELANPQSTLRLFNVSNVPPSSPPILQRQQRKPKQKEGGAAPKNIKSEATPVVAPEPKILTPPVQQNAATDTPRQVTTPTQRASNVIRPVTGA